MKRIVLGLCAMTGLFLASCNMGVKDSTAKESYAGFNLINPLDGGAPYTGASIYSVDMNVTKVTSTISSVLKYNNENMQFTSNEIPVVQELGSNLFKGFQANVNNNASLPLSNTNILVTYNFKYPYGQFVDPDNKNNVFTLDNFYPNKENSLTGGTPIDGVLYRPGATYAPIVVGSYQIGQDYKVTTFTTDRTYTGTTHTTYTFMGQQGSADPKTIVYRVILDIAKNKAAVVMYNAKFSNTGEPSKPVIYLSDLDLVWGNGTYSIFGKDVVPMAILGGQLDKMPDFTFSSFRMEATGQFMTDAVMNFTVINSAMGQSIEYKGFFEGSSVVIPDSMKR